VGARKPKKRLHITQINGEPHLSIARLVYDFDGSTTPNNICSPFSRPTMGFYLTRNAPKAPAARTALICPLKVVKSAEKLLALNHIIGICQEKINLTL
jgi:hypothetical protein